MAKRLLVNVEDSLHSKLKQRAAREGISMNALCARLLEGPDEEESKTPEKEIVELFEPMLYISLPLNTLREELQRVAMTKMDNVHKRSLMMKLNSEMAKRYRR